MPNSTNISLFLSSHSETASGNPGAITARPQQTFLKKVLLMAGTFCLLVGTSLCLDSRPAYAGLWFCNQTSDILYGVYAYSLAPFSTKGDWRSKGLYRVLPNDCREVDNRNLGQTFKRAVYVAAKKEGEKYYSHFGAESSTNRYFCVNLHSSFNIIQDGSSFKDGNGRWNDCYSLGDDYLHVRFFKTPPLHHRGSHSQTFPPKRWERLHSRDDCTVNFQVGGRIEYTDCWNWRHYESNRI